MRRGDYWLVFLALCERYPGGVDERGLDDPARTVLEAIDRLGSITARQAGMIVYRFRGFQIMVGIPQAWLVAAGRRVLNRLHAGGLVRPLSAGRWARCRG